MQNIEALPDYPVLRQVQKALWKIGEVHGAAVMVGAGFSRFANLAADTTPLAPLWSDFQKAMLDELYPKGGGPSDPLTLAEEYRAALGAPALENLIRCQVRDGEWSPGDIHRRLLSLPWSDVLTTNWDTLLERSVDSNPDLLYDVIRTPSDIAHTRSPRIVKLHGSLPSDGPFIFTQEDFRTYPTKFAPFVNLGRQVLLENELCLIGFSGDDPNFLEWSGWVRDQLGDAARPIRLLGNLDLSNSRRRLLESRNVIPIDLGPLVRDLPEEDRNRRAVEIFLEYLEQGKPPKAKWSPTSEDEIMERLPASSSRLADLAQVWKQDRETHPGWLVTPSSLRTSLRHSSSRSVSTILENLDTASKSMKATILYETIWRWETAFWPLPDSVACAASDLVSADEDDSLSLKKKIFLRAAIVRESRHRRDWSTFEERIQFLDKLNDPDADVEALYERCLKARDELDYNFIVENVERIIGDDPVWFLRRAALTVEVMDSRAAATLIHQAYREIRKRRAQDPRSLWLLSREAWALWLVENVRFESELSPFGDQPDWPLDYKVGDTDPWDELQEIDSSIAHTERKQRDDSRDRYPQFDAGFYSVPGTRFISFTVTSPCNDVIRLAEHVGIPFQLGFMNILGYRFSQAVRVSGQPDTMDIWASVRAMVANDIKSLDSHFSRVSVAKLPLETIFDAAHKVRGAIEFGKNKLTEVQKDGSTLRNVLWVNRMPDLIELLSRFGIRFQDEKALELFRFGVSLAHDPNVNDFLLFKSLENLMKRSLQALEPTRHGEAALDVLCLPLPSEKKTLFIQESNWINVIMALSRDAWRVRKQTDEWCSRIASLTEVINSGSSKPSRQDATYRLVKIFEAGMLTDEEAKSFGNAIWRYTDSNGFPTDIGLLPHVFLNLPAPDVGEVRKIFDTIVVTKLADGSFEDDLLQGLCGASYSPQGKYNPYKLKPREALRILDHALSWRRKKDIQFDFSGQNQEGDRIANSIGRALAVTVLPSLSASMIGDDRIKTLLDHASDGSLPTLLEALPVLVKHDRTLTGRVTEVIQRGLVSQHPDVVTSALIAVLWFKRFARSDNVLVPDVLVDETVSICLMRRDPGLISALYCVRLLIETGIVSETDRYRLVDTLALLRVETDYKNWRDETRSSDVSLIRQEAVRLAAALNEEGINKPILNEWITEARSDPMPEVRYALPVDRGS